MKTIAAQEQELIDDLNGLADELELVDYLIAAAVEAKKLPPEERRDNALVEGCQAKVWVHTKVAEDRVFVCTACDSLLIAGVLAILIKLLDGRSYREVSEYEIKFVDATAVRVLLSTDRRHGMGRVLAKIKQDARTCVEKQKVSLEIREFIQKKFYLPELPGETDELYGLAEQSIAAMASLPADSLRKAEMESGCSGASTAAIKKVLLLMAVKRKWKLNLLPEQSGEIRTVSDILNLFYEEERV